MKKDVLVYKTKDIAEMINKPITTVTNEIRKGNLKAIKSGKEYLIEKNELDRYLGIETKTGSLEKDLTIAKLEGELKSYKLKINLLKSLIDNLEALVGN